MLSKITTDAPLSRPDKIQAVWADLLGDIACCERIEKAWVRCLRGLYPEIDAADLAHRFLEHWREIARPPAPLDQVGNLLSFKARDLPGWQSLGAAIRQAGVAHSEADLSAVTVRLCSILLTSIAEEENTPAFRLVERERSETEQAVPERWVESGGLVGSSAAMRELAQRCGWAARDQYPVLILGPTGTGKEVLARLIHQLSNCKGRFVPVNCAALPAPLLEAELFGNERGAYTDASSARDGLFHLAAGGTLLLDEVSETPVQQQAKILRVLQDGLVRRVGGVRFQQVNARVIATSNRDLDAAIEAGFLRRDLYYRLAVHEIRTIPLRDHLEDVPELVAAFLARWRQGNAGLTVPVLDASAVEVLRQYAWPGNVRELEHAVYRLASRYAGEAIDLDKVRAAIPALQGNRPSPEEPAAASIRDTERSAVIRALAAAHGNKAAAARLLGVTRKTLYNKIRRYGLSSGES